MEPEDEEIEFPDETDDPEDVIRGIQAGLDDFAAGRVKPLAEALADIRRELKLSRDKTDANAPEADQ